MAPSGDEQAGRSIVERIRQALAGEASAIDDAPHSGLCTLVHPRRSLVVGMTCFGVFGGAAVVSHVMPDPATSWWTTPLLGVFALVGLLGIAGHVRVKHEVTEEGFWYRGIVGPRRFLPWRQVRRVRYSSGFRWFKLQGEDGAVLRVSINLLGLSGFAACVLQRAPRHAIGPSTFAVLEEAAAGRPPAMWERTAGV